MDGDLRVEGTFAVMRYICGKWGEELLGRNEEEVGIVSVIESEMGD